MKSGKVKNLLNYISKGKSTIDEGWLQNETYNCPFDDGRARAAKLAGIFKFNY